MRRVRIRLARAALVLLVAGFALLALGPLHLGAIRVGGVSLLWWYGGLVGPFCAACVTLAAFRSGPRDDAR